MSPILLIISASTETNLVCPRDEFEHLPHLVIKQGNTTPLTALLTTVLGLVFPGNAKNIFQIFFRHLPYKMNVVFQTRSIPPPPLRS